MKPLYEVFGYPTTDMSDVANHHRAHRLCPFGNIEPRCTKDKKDDPLGVCSVVIEGHVAITCPVRFRQHGVHVKAAAEFFFGSTERVHAVPEVRLKDADGNAMGNIDVVVCKTDGVKVVDYGALEVQAVYISGNVRDPFVAYQADPASTCTSTWDGKNSPRPDYLSSSRKRLIPQLITKGKIIRQWGKKLAVAIDRGFYQTLPPIAVVPLEESDLALLIFDVTEQTIKGQPHTIEHVQSVYTTYDKMLQTILDVNAGSEETFRKQLEQKLSPVLKPQP